MWAQAPVQSSAANPANAWVIHPNLRLGWIRTAYPRAIGAQQVQLSNQLGYAGLRSDQIRILSNKDASVYSKLSCMPCDALGFLAEIEGA
jgi:hypothetical protein